MAASSDTFAARPAATISAGLAGLRPVTTGDRCDEGCDGMEGRSVAARSTVVRVGLGLGLLVTLGACTGEGADDSGPQSADEQTSSAAGGEAGSPSETGSPTDDVSPTDGVSPTDDVETTEDVATTEIDTPAGPVEDPSGPDFVLYSVPECSVVPGGSLSGADSLTIFVALRNSGPGAWDDLVPFSLSSDTGLSGQGNTAISTGSSFTAMQVDLSADDYSQSHHFQIVADPANTIVERSESNNTIGIVVDLPSAPTEAVSVPCSTA